MMTGIGKNLYESPLKEMSDYLEIHYNTVSKVVKGIAYEK